MTRPYSMDLRERVVGLREAGVPTGTVARLFDVAAASVRSWRTQRRRTGSLAPKGRAKRGWAIDAHRGAIEQWVAGEPGLTLEQIRAHLRERCGFVTGLTTVHKALRRYGLTLKKSHSTRASRPARMSPPRARHTVRALAPSSPSG